MIEDKNKVVLGYKEPWMQKKQIKQIPYNPPWSLILCG